MVDLETLQRERPRVGVRHAASLQVALAELRAVGGDEVGHPGDARQQDIHLAGAERELERELRARAGLVAPYGIFQAQCVPPARRRGLRQRLPVRERSGDGGRFGGARLRAYSSSEPQAAAANETTSEMAKRFMSRPPTSSAVRLNAMVPIRSTVKSQRRVCGWIRGAVVPVHDERSSVARPDVERARSLRPRSRTTCREQARDVDETHGPSNFVRLGRRSALPN